MEIRPLGPSENECAFNVLMTRLRTLGAAATTGDELLCVYQGKEGACGRVIRNRGDATLVPVQNPDGPDDEGTCVGEKPNLSIFDRSIYAITVDEYLQRRKDSGVDD